MKGILRLFLVSLIALTFAGASFGQATPATPATPAKPAEKAAQKKEAGPKTMRVSGEIVALDAKAGTLTVKAKDKEMAFIAEGKGAKAGLEKIKVGEKVRVSYTDKDGKLIARSIAAAAPAKAPAAPKKEEKKAETKAEKKQ